MTQTSSNQNEDENLSKTTGVSKTSHSSNQGEEEDRSPTQKNLIYKTNKKKRGENRRTITLGGIKKIEKSSRS